MAKTQNAPHKLVKATIRLYQADIELIKANYPPMYGKPGINEVVREVIHDWVNTNLRQTETPQ